MRVTRQLVLEVDRREVPVGESMTVRVRDETNRPIEDATVEVGSQRHRTDPQGTCSITLQSPGFWRLTARRPPTHRTAYQTATGLVRAVPGSTIASSRLRSGPT